jgi:hypothetical protein
MRTPDRHRIASYVAPRVFAPGTRVALEGLGYRILAAATLGRFDDASWTPSLRIVDARYIERTPADGAPVVSVGAPRSGAAPRPVVGCVTPPIEIAALYPLLQRALEPHPRRAPRVPARIPARCTRADRRFSGEVVSLSEAGCLLRTQSDVEPGLEFNLLFPLPLGRMISTRACVASVEGADLGLEFTGASPQARAAISDYVARRLATL